LIWWLWYGPEVVCFKIYDKISGTGLATVDLDAALLPDATASSEVSVVDASCIS